MFPSHLWTDAASVSDVDVNDLGLVPRAFLQSMNLQQDQDQTVKTRLSRPGLGRQDQDQTVKTRTSLSRPRSDRQDKNVETKTRPSRPGPGRQDQDQTIKTKTRLSRPGQDPHDQDQTVVANESLGCLLAAINVYQILLYVVPIHINHTR